MCNIPIITSLKEEERLIESSTKVPGPLRAAGWGCQAPGLALTLNSFTARGEAAVQQKQQQVFLHQVGCVTGLSSQSRHWAADPMHAACTPSMVGVGLGLELAVLSGGRTESRREIGTEAFGTRQGALAGI